MRREAAAAKEASAAEVSLMRRQLASAQSAAADAEAALAEAEKVCFQDTMVCRCMLSVLFRQTNIESPTWLSFRLQRRPAACAATYYEMSQIAAHSTQMVDISASILASMHAFTC